MAKFWSLLTLLPNDSKISVFITLGSFPSFAAFPSFTLAVLENGKSVFANQFLKKLTVIVRVIVIDISIDWRRAWAVNAKLILRESKLIFDIKWSVWLALELAFRFSLAFNDDDTVLKWKRRHCALVSVHIFLPLLVYLCPFKAFSRSICTRSWSPWDEVVALAAHIRETKWYCSDKVFSCLTAFQAHINF